MLHATLIVVHAVAATACFALGLALVISPPSAPPSRRFSAFAALALVAMTALIAVVASDWATLSTTKRIAFAVLCGLALYLLVRVDGARRALRHRPDGWRRAFIGHVGFVLISLFDGFCIVAAIDLRAPPVVIATVAVLGVVAGVFGLRRAVRHDAVRQTLPPPGRI